MGALCINFEFQCNLPYIQLVLNLHVLVLKCGRLKIKKHKGPNTERECEDTKSKWWEAMSALDRSKLIKDLSLEEQNSF